MPKIQRLVPQTMHVHTHRTAGGERLPILLGADGIPPVLALRFALYQRDWGSSARLRLVLRRIGDLYDWMRHVDRSNLDEQVFAGLGIRLDQITRALHDLELLPLGAHEIRYSAPLRNGRCWAWSEFLRFIYRPGLWRTGLSVMQSHAMRRELDRELQILLEELGKKRQTLPPSARRHGLKTDELLCIDEVLHSTHPFCPFAESVLQRNVLMYGCARWGALRIGEILKAQINDLPKKEAPADRLVRSMQRQARSIHVVRRPDDFDDPREYEPSVKRADRAVELPDDLIDSLLAYVSETRELRPSPYLFLTQDRDRPLSQSRAHQIIEQLGRAAAKAFEQKFRHQEHTLLDLTWHRLRHTRALELVPVFFPEMRFDPQSERDVKRRNAFLEFFGWASPESADPYIFPLYQEDAGARMRAHYDDLRSVY